MTTLQEENSRLTALVRQQYGPAADALLTPLSHTLTGLTLTRGTMRNSIAGEMRLFFVWMGGFCVICVLLLLMVRWVLVGFCW